MNISSSSAFGCEYESIPMITPSEIIEYLYCPRFIYFMNCLNIPQREGLRIKVLKGREVHRKREKINQNYLRKKIHCVKKKSSVFLSSTNLGVRGIIDEILFFPDGSASPMDYKFARYAEFTYKTHKMQSVAYALLIKEIYKVPVNKGYICYVRSNNKIKEIIYSQDDFLSIKKIISNILEIINLGFFPRKTNYKNRCTDCTYSNICVKI